VRAQPLFGVPATHRELRRNSDIVAPLIRLSAISSDRDECSFAYGSRSQAAGGVLVLRAPAMLSVYMPPGMTQYGCRKEHDATKFTTFEAESKEG
jgi:hypothetical protein